MPQLTRPRPWRAAALAAPLLALACVVVVLVAAILRPVPTAPATGSPPGTAPSPAGTRTVVEHDTGDATVVVTVTEVGEDVAATMRISGDGHADVLVAEEVVVGTDHFVHVPAAEVVLGGDVWIRFDLTDPRHRAYLTDHPIGLIEMAAGLPTSSTGDRTVRREPIERPPTLGPPAAEVVGFEDLHELPDLRLPIDG